MIRRAATPEAKRSLEAPVEPEWDQVKAGPDLARLREDHGVRSVLCEGGPTLNTHLLAAGLVDELFLSVDPVLVGGEDALTIVAGRPPARASAAASASMSAWG